MIFTTINGKYQWHLRLYVGIICTARWNLELNSKITTSKSREIANYIKLLFFHRTSARSWCPPLASQLHCCYYCRHQFPPLSFFICNCCHCPQVDCHCFLYFLRCQQYAVKCLTAPITLLMPLPLHHDIIAIAPALLCHCLPSPTTATSGLLLLLFPFATLFLL